MHIEVCKHEKQDLAVFVSPVIYIHFSYVWLAQVVNILKVIEESQENTEILKSIVKSSNLLFKTAFYSICQSEFVYDTGSVYVTESHALYSLESVWSFVLSNGVPLFILPF